MTSPWAISLWFVVKMNIKWGLECKNNLPLLSFWWKSSECNDNISSNHSCPIPWIQGLFGMVPAMYVDLSPDRQSCIWTPSMWLTLSHVVSMEVFFYGECLRARDHELKIPSLPLPTHHHWRWFWGQSPRIWSPACWQPLSSSTLPGFCPRWNRRQGNKHHDDDDYGDHYRQRHPYHDNNPERRN